jgi:hypothetical protein
VAVTKVEGGREGLMKMLTVSRSKATGLWKAYLKCNGVYCP